MVIAKIERGFIMLCKNCGNEMNNGATFCNRCGVNHGNTQTGNNRHGNSPAINVASSACLKKNTRTELMPIIIIVAIIVGSFVFGGLKVMFSLLVDDDFGSPFGIYSDVIVSNSESGASFNCTMEEVIERYNDNIDEHIINDSHSDDEYEEIKNQLKLKKSYFEKETENKYFVSNSTYGITIQLDDNGNVYFIDMVWGNNLSDIESNVIMILLRGLIISVQPSINYDTATQIVIDTDNSTGILQKDNVKYMVTYESNCTRFSAVAMFDE